MGITTTAQNACTAQVWLDNGSGIQKNISGSTASAQLKPKVESKEFRTFGSTWPGRLTCGTDLPIKLEIVYSTIADEGWAILRDWFFVSHGASRTCTIYMPSKNVGADMIQGEYVLTGMDYKLVAGDAGAVIVSADIEPNGVVTHSVVAT